MPQSYASGTASSRPQSQDEAVLDPHMATLEKAPPESHKGTPEEAPPDPIINHNTNSPLLTKPTTGSSREPLGKPFSESPIITDAPHNEPC